MKVAVSPTSSLFSGDEFFNMSSRYNRDSSDRYPFYRLKEDLDGYGVEMHTCDVCDIKKCDKFLMFDYNERAAYEAGLFFGREDRILFLIEPPAVEPEMWSARNLLKYRSFFKRIYVYADHFVDNVNYFKYHIPPNHPVPSEKSLDECFSAPRKHLMAFIQSNRNSEYPGELYTYRRQLVKYFDSVLQDFHVYGSTWDCKSYCGKCTNKLETLRNYKFSLTIENQSMPGWISERILECFLAGCVPVYFGAPNITDYIPANTFIDIRDFVSMDMFLEYIVHMDKYKLEDYRQNIRNFLKSEKFYPFCVENFVKTIANSLGTVI